MAYVIQYADNTSNSLTTLIIHQVIHQGEKENLPVKIRFVSEDRRNDGVQNWRIVPQY